MSPKVIYVPYNGYELEVQLIYDVTATRDPSEGKFNIHLRGYTYLGTYFDGTPVDTPLTAEGKHVIDQLMLTHKAALENECYIWELLT